MIEPKLLKGFRDYMPDLMAPRQAMIRTIEATFETHGFLPLMTPALEYAETLTGKMGEEGDKLLYQFKDHGDRAVALRYDLTVPLARVVAQHRGEIQLPFRRYQIAPVWRADKPQRGRYREFMQCDADLAGANSALADAEVLLTGLAVLKALGIEDAILHINHRFVLTGLLIAAGVDAVEQQMSAIRAIDKLDKIGHDGVRNELIEQVKLSPDQAQAIVDIFADDGLTLDTVDALLVQRAGYEGEKRSHSIGRLREVVELVSDAGYAKMIRFNPTIARGLDYYTGIIYETRLTDSRVASIGAVMSGGRYDHLVSSFTKEQVPAVGVSLGLDRLLAAMQELSLIPQGLDKVPVYIAVMDPALKSALLQIAQTLRTFGLRCEVDVAGGKLGKQLERAAKRGATVCVLAGSDEIAAGTAVVKELLSGLQHTVTLEELGTAIAKILG